jgi:hypothetical protein
MSFIAMENALADDFSKRENIAYLMIGHLNRKGILSSHLFFGAGSRLVHHGRYGENEPSNPILSGDDGLLLYERVVKPPSIASRRSRRLDTTWTADGKI